MQVEERLQVAQQQPVSELAPVLVNEPALI
jgi:hypothetical protein